MQRYEQIGVQIMNRTQRRGARERPDRRRARRPRQARPRGAAARPGLRHGLPADLAQQEGDRADRRGADREEGALRRRARRDPRGGEAEDPEGRPDAGEGVARGLSTRGRFAVAYLLLGAAVGVGIGGLIVLVRMPAPQPGPPWSSWQPAASAPNSQVLEIADHVGSSYSCRPATSCRGQGRRARGRERLRRYRARQADDPRTLDDFQPTRTRAHLHPLRQRARTARSRRPALARARHRPAPRGARARALHDRVRPADRQRADLLPARRRPEEAQLDALLPPRRPFQPPLAPTAEHAAAQTAAPRPDRPDRAETVTS